MRLFTIALALGAALISTPAVAASEPYATVGGYNVTRNVAEGRCMLNADLNTGYGMAISLNPFEGKAMLMFHIADGENLEKDAIYKMKVTLIKNGRLDPLDGLRNFYVTDDGFGGDRYIGTVYDEGEEFLGKITQSQMFGVQTTTQRMIFGWNFDRSGKPPIKTLRDCAYSLPYKS